MNFSKTKVTVVQSAVAAARGVPGSTTGLNKSSFMYTYHMRRKYFAPPSLKAKQANP